MVAQKTGFNPRFVTIPSINTHIYESNLAVAKELTLRDVTPNVQVKVNNQPFHSLEPTDFNIIGYAPNKGVGKIIHN